MKANSWKIRIMFEIFMLFFTVLLGLLLIFECADIYYADYAIEYVQQKFVILIIPFAIYILSVVVGELISRIIPARQEYNPQTKKYFSGIAINKTITEVIIKTICNIFCLAVGVFCIIKFATFSLTEENVNAQILTLLKCVAPLIIACFLLWLVVAIFKFPYHKRKGKFFAFFESEKFIFSVRIFIIAIAVMLIILGILNGGQHDVLMKAVKICRECIGIG